MLWGLCHLQLYGLSAELSQLGHGSGGNNGVQAASASLLSAVLFATMDNGSGVYTQLQAWHSAVYCDTTSDNIYIGVSREINGEIKCDLKIY